jgi:hypothetical protein
MESRLKKFSKNRVKKNAPVNIPQARRQFDIMKKEVHQRLSSIINGIQQEN